MILFSLQLRIYAFEALQSSLVTTMKSNQYYKTLIVNSSNKILWMETVK